MKRTSAWVLIFLAVFAASGVRAQTVIEGSDASAPVRLLTSDSSVLESQEVRKDLPCTVTPIKAALGFDLRFHTGYEVSIPLKGLAGAEDLLTIIFRVTPDEHKDDPVYLSQRVGVPAIEENAQGSAYLHGEFQLGEGRYHVDFLVRDHSQRVCSFYWDVEAELPPKDKRLMLMVASDTVQAAERDPFKEEPPVQFTENSRPLNVKVIINFAPQNSNSAALQTFDTNALASVLRIIAREPKIRRFSIIAFNIKEERVVYRQENTVQIDFPALGEALNSLSLGTVDLRRLGQKHGESEFLAELLNKEMNNSGDHPDAVIFAGPKTMLDESVPQNSLNQLGDVDYPVFYMNVSLNPQANPWRDAIGSVVKRLRGYQYTISRPRDLWYAWTEIVTRIVNSQLGKSSSGASQ